MVWILGSAALVWSAMVASPSFGLRDGYQRSFCPEEYLPAHYHYIYFGTFTLGILLPPIFGACVGLASCFWRCGWREMWKSNWLRHTVRGFTILFAAVCCLFNWATLVMLLVFVTRTSWFMRTTWGVGQGLALATWMPLLWEIAYTMKGESEPFDSRLRVLGYLWLTMNAVGIDKASETGLQKEFFVVRESDTEDVPELVPGSVLGPRGRRQAEMVEQAQGTTQTGPPSNRGPSTIETGRFALYA
jgi:hypothetical protein